MSSENAAENQPIPREQKPKPPPVHGAIPKGMDLVNHVAECLHIGCDTEDIRLQLLSFGFKPKDADQIIADVIDWRRRNPGAGSPSSGGAETNDGGLNANMLIGATIFFAGIVVTIFTFIASRGGGMFIFAWGAIAFGFLQFVRGAAQRQREKDAGARRDGPGGDGENA